MERVGLAARVCSRGGQHSAVGKVGSVTSPGRALGSFKISSDFLCDLTQCLFELKFLFHRSNQVVEEVKEYRMASESSCGVNIEYIVSFLLNVASNHSYNFLQPSFPSVCLLHHSYSK
jgi:hypothetical protein